MSRSICGSANLCQQSPSNQMCANSQSPSLVATAKSACRLRRSCPRLLKMRWLDVFPIMITFSLLLIEPISSRPDWIEKLNSEIYGTLYSASGGVDTSKLIPSYTVAPFPVAEPPLAVLVARGAAILDPRQSSYVSRLALDCIGLNDRDSDFPRHCLCLQAPPTLLQL